MPTSFSKKITFQDIVGWEDEAFEGAYGAIHNSFEIFLKNPDSCPLEIRESLQKIADIFFKSSLKTRTELRRFFENFFEPMCFSEKTKGFFTAYYEIALRGSRTKSDRYGVPLYAVPSDLERIKISKDGQIHPYYTREEIMKDALKQEPFLWVDDPIEAYFLHVQGSGLINLENGDVLRVGHSGNNRHPYVSLRGILEDDQKIFAPGSLTKESLEGYLRTLSPAALSEVLALNPRYIFFEEIKLVRDEGPRGHQGKPGKAVSLTPLRSLAVDHHYIPLGLPVWVQVFDLNSDVKFLFPRLMMAQDTGSAIKGPNRGDIFWGTGDKAGKIAGNIRNVGDMIVFFPKSNCLN